jgi:hypothetical protein
MKRQPTNKDIKSKGRQVIISTVQKSKGQKGCFTRKGFLAAILEQRPEGRREPACGIWQKTTSPRARFWSWLGVWYTPRIRRSW